MNKYLFIYKLLIKKHNSQKINWSLIFPFIGVITGSVIISLTIGIMEGMEYSIFSKLKELSYPARLTNVKENDSAELESYIKNNKLYKSLEEQVIISNDGEFKVANMIGSEDYYQFKNDILNKYIIEHTEIQSEMNVYIGKNLASRLNLSAGDSAIALNPKRINIFTGLPYAKKILIGGVYDINLLDFNQNYIYCNYDLIRSLSQTENANLLLERVIDNESLNLINEKFPDVSYYEWDHNYHSFVSAMKLEKIIYSCIGFLIILIAAFTLMSMMSLSVMKKIPQIGILMSLGIKRYQVKYIFMVQSISTAILGCILGIFISHLIIIIDDEINLIKLIFSDQLLFDFPILLSKMTIFIIFIFSLIILTFSGLYPSIKASKVNLIQSIGSKK